MVFRCSTGYTLDPAIGAVYSCNNGVWSTKPQCLSRNPSCRLLRVPYLFSFYLKEIGRCPLVSLTTLLSTRTGLRSTGQIQLMQTPDDPKLVLNGSYVVLGCMSGYTNIGGSPNVTCSADSSWTPFPNCVASTDTTISGAAARCSVTSAIFNLAYGSPTNTTGLLVYQEDMASGTSMVHIALKILSCEF